MCVTGTATGAVGVGAASGVGIIGSMMVAVGSSVEKVGSSVVVGSMLCSAVCSVGAAGVISGAVGSSGTPIGSSDSLIISMSIVVGDGSAATGALWWGSLESDGAIGSVMMRPWT